jgi:DNA-binding response OmpR family regulator
MKSPETKPHALIVDDEPELIDHLKDLFQELGFEVDVAIDYRDAVEHINHAPPDFLFINLSLPRDSGYDVCEFARKTPTIPGIPILVMSDRRSPEDIAFAEEAGADAFLTRPFSRETLRAQVLAMLEKYPTSIPGVRQLAGGGKVTAS